MTTAVPEGFAPFKLSMGFLEANGPLYGKWTDDHLLLGFMVEMRHCNPGRVCHGGMLATFADMFLPIAARFQTKTDMGFLPTVNLSCDFLAPAPLGAWVESRADALTITRNLLFAQGVATADGAPVLRANGIFQDHFAGVYQERRFFCERTVQFQELSGIELGGRIIVMANDFKGFPKDFFAFFRELRANNERRWFESNKQRFRDSVQAPMSDFIAAMAPRLAKGSKHFTADPRPNGGSMFRIYRDVRFSKDKSPYKVHAACHFRHVLGKDAHAPGFYVHLSPDETFFGGGLWMPPPDALAKIRQAIASNLSAWKKVLGDKAFRKHFDAVSGESLSRPPRGFDPGHPFIADIKKKSFYAMREEDMKLASSPRLVDEVADTFASVSPLMRFLCGALDVPF